MVQGEGPFHQDLDLKGLAPIPLQLGVPVVPVVQGAREAREVLFHPDHPNLLFLLLVPEVRLVPEGLEVPDHQVDQ